MTMHGPRAVLLVVLLVYLAGSLSGLSVYPSVGEDEPWIAAAPYTSAPAREQAILALLSRSV
jgi:hypothetical protein